MNVEDAMIGTLLKETHLLSDLNLRPEHFLNTQNRKAFETMRQLAAEGRPTDMVAILTTADPLTFGGASRLSQLTMLSNPLKIDGYVDVVLDVWRDREKNNLLFTAKEENWSIDKITSELSGLIDDRADDYNSIADLLIKVYEDPWIKKNIVAGTQTGQADLQNATGGWQNGDLIIVAARPSMGKTDVMLHLARAAGWSGVIPIVFSLEMSAARLRDRMIAAVGNYNRSKMSDTYSLLTDSQKKVWPDALKRLRESNIRIFDKSRQSIAEIRMKVRKIRNENPGKPLIVFIDYLTLIRGMDDFKGNMHLQVSEITKSLKALAKEFECPVISLAQLSRGIEQWQDKRPMMSDLRESGSIEEDADVIAFLYREAYYVPETERQRELEIIIAKHRNGETGTIIADYNKYTGVIT